MKNLLLTLVLFSLILNFSVAIMIDVIPSFSDMDKKIGLDSAQILEISDTELLDQFGNPLNGYPAMEDANNVNTNTLMDRVGLGALSSILNFFNKYIFGFVQVLQAMFGAHVNAAIFTVLKSVIGLVYAIAAVELFTGARFD